jgi:uncharacterized protein (TIGR02145 family)
MKPTVKIFSILLLISAVILFSLVVTGCKKGKENLSTKPIEYSTMTDIDGNTYKTVKIGNQWWMAENLKVKKYRNGLPVKQVTFTDPDSLWAQAVKGYYCEFQYNSTFSNVYGYLYNWYAVNDTSNIAPAGWHVASDAEWKSLEESAGMSTADADRVNWRGNDEGSKLKIHAPDGWTTYGNVWSYNETGFTALAGACRLFNGGWADPNIQCVGFWWTSTQHPGNNQAWFRNLDYKKTSVFRYYTYKSYGMSVRCVKD